MKSIALLVAVLTLFSGKAVDKAEVIIKISNCRDTQSFAYLKELTVLKDGSEFRKLQPQYDNEQILTGNEQILKDLGKGEYSFVYTSLFGKQESLNLSISEFKEYSVDLCIDFIDHSKDNYKPIIAQLKENESFEINVYSQGCFYHSQDKIVIKRLQNEFAITWGQKTKTLTQADIEAISKFEVELNYMTDGGCTTTDTYVVTYNEVTKRITDGSCRWRGYYYLQKQLFGNN